MIRIYDTLLDNYNKFELYDKSCIYKPKNPVSNGDLSEDIRIGLTNPAKYLLPKYFYDTKGSKLFEEITQLEEYYPTEVERSIIKNISSLLPHFDTNISTIVEIGSGSSNKTHHILKAYLDVRDEVHYIPMDISDIIIESSENLLNKFDNLFVEGIIADYDSGLEVVSYLTEKPKLYLFLGSSIGNFTHNESINFLSNLSSMMSSQDRLLIGFDRVKDRNVLLNAYDDKSGVTAKFNLNILERINKELNANFDLNAFDHQVLFNEEKSRIEMHLVSNKLQEVNIANLNLQVQFQIDESIHTENSYKYSDKMINNLAKESGFDIEENFADDLDYFSLCVFKTI